VNLRVTNGFANIAALELGYHLHMNWLAHLYLSEPSAEFRVGNLLPDLLPIGELAYLPSEFQRGIEQHRKIDAFTDSHPIVRECINRVPSNFRRFGGVLIDLFFDHFLARDWNLYSSKSLPFFANEIYDSFDGLHHDLPHHVLIFLDKIRAHNVLCTYQNISGIAAALERIDSRLRRPIHLGKAIFVLEQGYAFYYSDFRAFFPELQRHVGPNS
jgi:acyl carrier protein phosphodiesterase